jgi:2-amino-4-hydroxy-6-hydroxymethyldihydropteridine diphosphokinase
MVLIGIGANLPDRHGRQPRATCEAALRALPGAGIVVTRRSRWYRSAPLPPSDQPWYVNGVVCVATALAPADLLAALHRIEATFGRLRPAPDAARPLDLDLLAYGARIVDHDNGLVLPHPRLHERAFVLAPLAEIAPSWRHPVSHCAVADLIAALPPGQICTAID